MKKQNANCQIPVQLCLRKVISRGHFSLEVSTFYFSLFFNISLNVTTSSFLLRSFLASSMGNVSCIPLKFIKSKLRRGCQHQFFRQQNKSHSRKKVKTFLLLHTHYYTIDAPNLPILPLGVVCASTVVNIWGIDRPPEITISAPQENQAIIIRFIDEFSDQYKIVSIFSTKVVPIPSRTDRLGLRISLELIRNMSPMQRWFEGT